MSPRSARIASAVIFVLVLVGAFVPGHEKHLLLNPFPGKWRVDKIGHTIGFMALSFSLVRCRFSAVRPWHIAIALVVLAALTEAGQMFIEGRTAAIADVFIDSGGALIGILAALAIRSSSGPAKSS
jgi:VanZ family protein